MHNHVLIVDDDITGSRRLARVLRNAGYAVEEVNDSQRALETAKRFKPDYVILDYLMPVVHGGDVAWQLASDPKLSRTKIIVCSGAPKSEIAIKLPPARIPIMEKPVDMGQLLLMLHENLQN